MKSALIAIDPMAVKEKAFQSFCQTISLFEEKGIYSRASIAAVIHASQFLMPYSHYTKHKDELAREARKDIRDRCSGEFRFANVHVIQSNSPHNEDIVELLSRCGRRSDMDLMVVGSSDRKGLPYWFLGSISETASFTAKIPILVFKEKTPSLAFSRHTNFVVGVDVAAPPSSAAITWLSALGQATQARIHLLYVEAQKRPIVNRLQARQDHAESMSILNGIRQAFERKGIDATVSIKKEARSIPHVLVDFAEKKGALLTVATTPKRSTARRLLLGSTARHMLALTKRPFLSLRME